MELWDLGVGDSRNDTGYHLPCSVKHLNRIDVQQNVFNFGDLVIVLGNFDPVAFKVI